MMYSDFKVWSDENNHILENLKHATPQEMMEELIRSQKNEIQNNIIRLRNELNNAKINAFITNTDYNFGRDEKGRMIFTAKQAARATINSYKLNWFQYVWNLLTISGQNIIFLKK